MSDNPSIVCVYSMGYWQLYQRTGNRLQHVGHLVPTRCGWETFVGPVCLGTFETMDEAEATTVAHLGFDS